MAEKTYDGEVIRETFRKHRKTFLERLPIETLPTKLAHEDIISDSELSIVQGHSSTVRQRQKLVDILLTKDDSALLRVVKILETCECGYKDLARKFFAHMDAMQTEKDRKSAKTPKVKVRKSTQQLHVETIRSSQAPSSQQEVMKDSAEPHPQLDERLESTTRQLGNGQLCQHKDFVVLDAWKRDALLRHEDDLRANLNLDGLVRKLDNQADGFMTVEERKSVEDIAGLSKKVGRIVEILRVKGNKEFDVFLKLLKETGNRSLASKLGRSAQLYKSEHPRHVSYVQILVDNAEEFLKNMNSAAISKRLRAMGLIPDHVDHEIRHATNRDDRNGILLTHLKVDASREQVLDVFKVASEKRSYNKMEEFAIRMLEELQQEEQSGRSHLCSPTTCRCVIIACVVMALALLVCFPCHLPGKVSDTRYLNDFMKNSSTVNVSNSSIPTICPSSSTGWSSGHSTSSPVPQEQALCRHSNTKLDPTPTTDSTIVALPPMPIELQVVSSVLLEEKVYVTGFAKVKAAKDDVSRRVQVYSLSKGEWSTLRKCPNHNAPIAVVNGHITLIGGRDAQTSDITDALSWLTKERSWVKMQMPTRRLESGVCYHDNLLLVTGGVVSSTAKQTGKEAKSSVVVNTVDVYNFSSKHWSTPEALKLPKVLRSHHLVVFEDILYLMGGAFTFPAPPEDGEEQYNPEAWRARWSDVIEAIKQPTEKSLWTPTNAPPVLRPTAVACDDSLLSVGGVKNGMPQKAIYKFVNGKTESYWTEVGNMSVGKYRHGVVPLCSGSRAALFIAGGYVRSAPEGEEGNVRSSSVELVLL